MVDEVVCLDKFGSVASVGDAVFSRNEKNERWAFVGSLGWGFGQKRD